MDNVEEQDLHLEEPTEITPVLTPKRTRAKRTPKMASRTIEQLHQLTPRTMTDAEKQKYIDALRDDNIFLTSQNQELNESCKSAFAKARAIEQQFHEYKNKARGLIHFHRQAISTCHNSILLAGNLED